MDEPRVPDLERMNEQQAENFLVEMFTHLSAVAEYESRHEDYVMEMPQYRRQSIGLRVDGARLSVAVLCI
jgi:hypothetical protein